MDRRTSSGTSRGHSGCPVGPNPPMIGSMNEAPEMVSILARAASVSLLGETDDGIPVDVVTTSTPAGPLGNLILDLTTGIGPERRVSNRKSRRLGR
jgi:hypothetical protein